MTMIELHYAPAPAPAVSTGNALLTWTADGETHCIPCRPGQVEFIADIIDHCRPAGVRHEEWAAAIKVAVGLGAKGHSGTLLMWGAR